MFKPEDPRYSTDFYSEYRLLNTANYKEYSSKFEIRVLSLNQLENASEEEKNNPNGLYNWARIFKASTWEELIMIAEKNPMMDSFVGTVMQLTAEEKVAQACERRRRYSNDIATYEEEIETAKAKIDTLEATVSDIESIIADKESIIADKDSIIADKDTEIASKDDLIASKDKEILRLKSLLESQNKD